MGHALTIVKWCPETVREDSLLSFGFINSSLCSISFLALFHFYFYFLTTYIYIYVYMYVCIFEPVRLQKK